MISSRPTNQQLGEYLFCWLPGKLDHFVFTTSFYFYLFLHLVDDCPRRQNQPHFPRGEVVGEEALRFAESEGGKALMKATGGKSWGNTSENHPYRDGGFAEFSIMEASLGNHLKIQLVVAIKLTNWIKHMIQI